MFEFRSAVGDLTFINLQDSPFSFSFRFPTLTHTCSAVVSPIWDGYENNKNKWADSSPTPVAYSLDCRHGALQDLTRYKTKTGPCEGSIVHGFKQGR